jgi:hypothetical protein
MTLYMPDIHFHFSTFLYLIVLVFTSTLDRIICLLCVYICHYIYISCHTEKKNVQIIKRKYIMTNINTQETDFYSVYINMCNFDNMMGSAIIFETTFPYCIVPVYVFVCHMFPYHPFYFDFHSARVIFDVSSSFYFWNVNRTPTWHLSKMFKVAFKDVSTKNSEPTYWTILFVMLKLYFIYKVAEKKSRRAI